MSHYSSERLDRQDYLRSRGFKRAEYIPLSRIKNEADPALRDMVKSRAYLLRQFNIKAENHGWEGGTKKYYWYKNVIQFYKRNHLLTKESGQPFVFVWYRAVEARQAKRANMPVVDFRRKKKEDTILKAWTSGAKRQMNRAKSRARHYRGFRLGTSELDILAIRNMRRTVRDNPERDAILTRQARNIGFTGASLLRWRR